MTSLRTQLERCMTRALDRAHRQLSPRTMQLLTGALTDCMTPMLAKLAHERDQARAERDEAQQAANVATQLADTWEREHQNTVLPYTSKIEAERDQAQADLVLAAAEAEDARDGGMGLALELAEAQREVERLGRWNETGSLSIERLTAELAEARAEADRLGGHLIDLDTENREHLRVEADHQWKTRQEMGRRLARAVVLPEDWREQAREAYRQLRVAGLDSRFDDVFALIESWRGVATQPAEPPRTDEECAVHWRPWCSVHQRHAEDCGLKGDANAGATSGMVDASGIPVPTTPHETQADRIRAGLAKLPDEWADHIGSLVGIARSQDAPEQESSSVRTLHVTTIRDIREGHTDQRVHYRFEGEYWDGWLIGYDTVDGIDEAYVMRDDGKRWVVLRENVTEIDAGAPREADAVAEGQPPNCGWSEAPASPFVPGTEDHE